MGHSSCCVVNCKNTGRNSKCKFYRFPRATWKLEQCKKWIIAVKRKNADGSPWYPKPSDLICSDHFIGGKKSDESASPSYVPTIFPSIYRSKISNESVAISRYRRFMERRKKNELSNTIPTNQPFIHSPETCHQEYKKRKIEASTSNCGIDFVDMNSIDNAYELLVNSAPIDDKSNVLSESVNIKTENSAPIDDKSNVLSESVNIKTEYDSDNIQDHTYVPDDCGQEFILKTEEIDIKEELLDV